MAKKKYAKKVPPTTFGLESKQMTNPETGEIYTLNVPTDKHAKYAAKQGFKSQCDINTIIDTARVSGVLAHTEANAGFYADLDDDFDYESATIKIAEANSAFYGLDVETRREFDNNPGRFHKWCAGKTVEQIVEKLPQLAQPGTQLRDVAQATTSPQATTDPTPPVTPDPPANDGGAENTEGT